MCRPNSDERHLCVVPILISSIWRAVNLLRTMVELSVDVLLTT